MAKKEITTEPFVIADASVGPYDQQIKNAIKSIYLADVEAIRNLSNFAVSMSQGGTTLPGNLTTTGLLTSQGGIISKGDIMTISGYLTSTNGGSIEAGTLRQTDIVPNEIAFRSYGTAHYNIKNDPTGKFIIRDASTGGIGSAGTDLLTLSSAGAIFNKGISAQTSAFGKMKGTDMSVNNISSNSTGATGDININSPLVVNKSTKFISPVTFDKKVNINALQLTNSLYYPGMVGAYLIKGGSWGQPLMFSITVLSTFLMDNAINVIVLVPGFKLEVFDTVGYAGSAAVLTNTTYAIQVHHGGTAWAATSFKNSAPSSLRLSYLNAANAYVEIPAVV